MLIAFNRQLLIVGIQINVTSKTYSVSFTMKYLLESTLYSSLFCSSVGLLHCTLIISSLLSLDEVNNLSDICLACFSNETVKQWVYQAVK